MSSYVEAWVRGWVHSRSTPPPEEFDGGLFVRTASPRESCRWVLTDPTEQTLKAVLAQQHPPRSCVKFAGDPGRWLPRFPLGWVADEPGWFMTADLERPPNNAALPGDYHLESVATPDLVTVAVTAPDGSHAATGRCGLTASHAVPDQIVTEPSHQRRGLGTAIMHEIHRQARSLDIRHAVLCATTDGRHLYEQLGWTVRGPLVGAYKPAPQAPVE